MLHRIRWLYFLILIAIIFYSYQLLSSYECTQGDEHIINYLDKSLVFNGSVSKAMFDSILMPYDAVYNVRSIRMKFMNQNKTMYSFVDNFLSTRPWWFISQEKRSKVDWSIEIQRFNLTWLSALEELSMTQYPQRCNIPTIIGYSNRFHTWGTMFSKYTSSAQVSDSALFVPFIRDTFSNRTVFLDVNSKYCFSLVNKYDCAFLPASNCTGKYVADLSAPVLYASYFFAYQDNDVRQQLTQQEFKSHMGLIDASRRKTNKDSDCSTRKENHNYFVSVGYRGLFKSNYVVYAKRNRFRAREVLLTHGLLLRPNFVFRSRIRDIVDEYAERFPFLNDRNCTAIHIRRGDRVLDSPIGYIGNHNNSQWNLSLAMIGGQSATSASRIDIYKLCELHKKFPDGTCLDPVSGEKSMKHCTFWNDKGCAFGAPFASITMDRYLTAATVLNPKTANLMIMTDDGEWVEKELGPYRSMYNSIAVHAAPTLHRVNSVRSGVHFLASVELVRRCNGIVGHMKSAVMKFLIRVMCFRHANSSGVCPPFFDLSQPDWRSD